MKSTRGRIGIWLKRSALCGVLLFATSVAALSVPLVSYQLVDQLQTYPALTSGQISGLTKDPPTAIVILAAGRRVYAPEFGGESLDAFSLERTRYGAELARRTELPVLVSGGLGTNGRPPLAALLADTLSRDYGVKAKWQETRSANTAENAIYSAEVLHGAGINRVILVTHAWHMRRARAAFEANGMSVMAAPTAFYGLARDNSWRELVPTASALRMSGYALHEMIGREWYALKYGY